MRRDRRVSRWFDRPLAWMASVFAPAPTPRRKRRRVYVKAVCPACGRTFAATADGRVWKHICAPTEAA